MNFNGQVAVVTGAGRGMGKEYALKLAAMGCKVVVNNRTPEKADEVVAEIKANGGIAVADYSNVATEGEKAVEHAIKEFGTIHILINNAGQLRDKTLKGMTLEMFTDVLNTHGDNNNLFWVDSTIDSSIVTFSNRSNSIAPASMPKKKPNQS